KVVSGDKPNGDSLLVSNVRVLNLPERNFIPEYFLPPVDGSKNNVNGSLLHQRVIAIDPELDLLPVRPTNRVCVITQRHDLVEIVSTPSLKSRVSEDVVSFSVVVQLATNLTNKIPDDVLTYPLGDINSKVAVFCERRSIPHDQPRS